MSRVFSVVQAKDELIIVVPPGSLLEVGFGRAQKAFLEGKSVRLIGHGVSLDRTWPEWVFQVNNSKLILTELGAYALEAYFSPWIIELRKALRGWIGALNLETVFLSSTQARFISMDKDSSKYMAMVAMHPKAKFEFTDLSWDGVAIYQELLNPSHPVSNSFAMKVILGVSAASLVSIYRVTRDYVSSRGVRRELKCLNLLNRKVEPEAWFVLMPSNKRINYQLIQFIRTAGTRSLGLIMAGDLRPVLQRDRDLKPEKSNVFMEGLGEISERLQDFKVEQLSPADSLSELLLLIAGFILMSARTTCKLILQGPILNMCGGVSIDLNQHISAIIRLLSIDMLNVQLGYRAAVKLQQRNRFLGKPVLFPSANSPDIAAACSDLSKNGALCMEHVHGIGALASEAAPIKIRWNRSERVDFESMGERIVYAGMPVNNQFLSSRRILRDPVRVLFLTGYAHRDSSVGGGFPWQCFQEEMLNSVAMLEKGPVPLSIRWRSHPADQEEIVLETAKKYRKVVLSKGCSFEDDLLWADIVVSNLLSSVVSQALYQGYPVFAHVIPEWDDINLTKFISPRRTFFRSEDLAPKLFNFLNLYKENPSEAMKPEQEARRALWGELEKQEDFWEELDRLCLI